MRISAVIALSVFACCMNSNGAATVTASRDYVDRKTTLHPSSNGVEQAGYFLGTQTNKVLASKEYVDYIISDFRSDRITDGTNIIDAARTVFQLQDGYGEWSWTIDPEAADAGFYIHWGDSAGVYDGWYFDGGVGEWGGPDYYLGGDSTSTNLTYTGPFGYGTEYTVTFSRSVIHGSITNIVGRLALTNDVSQVASLARSKTDLAVYASETTQWRCIYVEPSGSYSNLTNMNLWTLDTYPYNGVIYPNVYYDGTFMFDSSETMTEDEYDKETLWTIDGYGESGDEIRISFSRQVAGLDTGNRLATTSDIPAFVSADLSQATNYTDFAIGSFAGTGTVSRAFVISDGTNIIDAAGLVWQVTSTNTYTDWHVTTNGIPFKTLSWNGVDWADSDTYMSYNDDAWSFSGPWIDGLYIGSEDILSFTTETSIISYGEFVNAEVGFSRDSAYAYTTNLVGRIALTNDIPDSVTIVAPSTNAVSGTAADAKATGTALYTGFTEWEFSGYSEGVRISEIVYDGGNWWRLELDYEDSHYSPDVVGDPDATELYFRGQYKEPEDTIRATRHLITPTKTSQLTNDGTNGVPFAVLSDAQVNAIDSVVDNRQTVVVYSNGTTNRLDLVGGLSRNDIPNIDDATSVRIGSTVTSIGSMAFDSCTSLTSVTIGNGVTIIREDAFYGCTSLTSVMIGNSVMSIVDNAFSSCSSLMSVTIPDSMTSIGDSAFSECSGLTNVIFKGKSLAEVSLMPNYPWGITDTSIIKTENEVINKNGHVNVLGSFSQGHDSVVATNLYSFGSGTNVISSGIASHAEGDRTVASGKASHAEGIMTRATGEASHASGVNVFVTQRATFGAGVSVNGTNSASFIWSGNETSPWYGTHGKGSFNANPIGGAYGFFIGNDNLIQVISSSLLAEEPQEVTIEYDDGQPVTTNYPSLRAVVEQIVLETIRKNSLSGIYDQQLQTWWTPVMVNGGYKFMATTNIDMNAESEY